MLYLTAGMPALAQLRIIWLMSSMAFSASWWSASPDLPATGWGVTQIPRSGMPLAFASILRSFSKE